MTKQETITTGKGIAVALAAAQMEMGKALKQSTNPHFRSKYADLSSVMDACLEPLNRHGIAVIQPTGSDEAGQHVKTILIHGETGETLECVVPLIVQKNDMQGYGSAVTYARRYGLMAMAGIAPEDDGGNAASKAAPNANETVSPDQFIKLRDLAGRAGISVSDVCAKVGANSLEQFPASKFQGTVKGLETRIREKRGRHDLQGDEIPY
jgi:hypothetical protein